MSDKRRHVIALPAPTWAEIRARVGSRGISAYISQAAARQLERDASADLTDPKGAGRGREATGPERPHH